VEEEVEEDTFTLEESQLSSTKTVSLGMFYLLSHTLSRFILEVQD